MLSLAGLVAKLTVCLPPLEGKISRVMSPVLAHDAWWQEVLLVLESCEQQCSEPARGPCGEGKWTCGRIFGGAVICSA